MEVIRLNDVILKELMELEKLQVTLWEVRGGGGFKNVETLWKQSGNVYSYGFIGGMNVISQETFISMVVDAYANGLVVDVKGGYKYRNLLWT